MMMMIIIIFINNMQICKTYFLIYKNNVNLIHNKLGVYKYICKKLNSVASFRHLVTSKTQKLEVPVINVNITCYICRQWICNLFNYIVSSLAFDLGVYRPTYFSFYMCLHLCLPINLSFLDICSYVCIHGGLQHEHHHVRILWQVNRDEVNTRSLYLYNWQMVV